MINSLVPLMYVAVVGAFIVTGIQLLYSKKGFKEVAPTFLFGAILAAIASKPALLGQVGITLITLIQNFGGKINV